MLFTFCNGFSTRRIALALEKEHTHHDAAGPTPDPWRHIEEPLSLLPTASLFTHISLRY